MQTVAVSYPGAVPGVNVSAPALSFFRWVCRWHAQTGNVSPSTSYLARKQRKSERTVYRWLAQLKAAQLVAVEVVEGVERSIVPIAPPPPAPARRRSPGRSVSGVVSGVLSGVVSGVLHEDAHTQNAHTQNPEPQAAGGLTPASPVGQVPPLAADDAARLLVAEGVAPRVAAVLVAECGPEQVREQVAALDHRKPRDRASVLVKSIREAWAVPAAYVAALERKRSEQQRAAAAAAAAALERKRAEQRQGAQIAFSALPGAVQADLMARAAAAVQREQPAAWRVMRAAARDALVRNRALLLAAQEVAR